MKEKISVLIADDNQDFSHTLSTYINSQEDMKIIAVAKDGEEVLNILQNTSPDVMILDVIMPHLDGLGVLEKMNESSAFMRLLKSYIYDRQCFYYYPL